MHLRNIFPKKNKINLCGRAQKHYFAEILFSSLKALLLKFNALTTNFSHMGPK